MKYITTHNNMSVLDLKLIFDWHKPEEGENNAVVFITNKVH